MFSASHLSEILEKSEEGPVIIFKYSTECGSSSRLYLDLQKKIKEKVITNPVYIVTVQNQDALSKNIAEFFEVQHESPQILIINKKKLIYTAHHDAIKTEDFIYF